MEITRTSGETVILHTLNVGDVFYFPDDVETIYMVINKRDFYLDYSKISLDKVAFVDLENGGIYISNHDAEVIEVHGSFVIS